MATNEADKAAETARKDAEAVQAAEEKARLAKLSPEERKVEEAKARAGDSESKALDAEGRAAQDEAAEATRAEDVKGVSAAVDPSLDIGAHHAQTFANVPENPQLAPGLDPADGADVRLELNDSDHPDPAHPKVTYVHEKMVGDYLRAGWRRPVA